MKLRHPLIACILLLAAATAQARWSQVESVHPARWGHTLEYRPSAATYVMFGGQDNQTVFGNMMEFDRDRLFWEIYPATGPAARYEHGMEFVPYAETALIFGGTDGTDVYGDLWAFDMETGAWQDLSPMTGPAPRYGHQTTWDMDRNVLVVYGGRDNSGTIFGDLWEYAFDTDEWTEITSATPPPPRYYHVMEYHPTQKFVFMANGRSDTVAFEDFWQYYPADANRDWVEVFPSGDVYTARTNAAISYERIRDQLVILGGIGTDGITYKQLSAYNPNFGNIGPYSSGGAVTPREGAQMIYDFAREELIISGGYNSPNSEVKEDLFNRVFFGFQPEWENIPGNSPPGLAEASLAVDPLTEDVYLFGGTMRMDGNVTVNGTLWSYAQADETWFPEETTGGPSGRSGAGMWVDSDNGRLILHGGKAADGSPLSDTWFYDLNTGMWMDSGAGNAPLPSGAVGYGYDDAADLIYVLYAEGRPGWSFATYTGASGWVAVETSDGPSLRENPDIAFDPSEVKFVVHGGIDAASGDVLTDTWEFFPQTNTWRERPSANEPSPRTGATAVFEPQFNQMLLVSGVGDVNGTMALLDETWAFHPWLADFWDDATQIINPAPRQNGAMARNVVGDSATLFGGIGDLNGSVYLRDLWNFRARRDPGLATPTPLVTPTPMATPTPEPPPTEPFLLAGYWDTDLEANVPGRLNLTALAFDLSPNPGTFTGATILLGGGPLGLNMAQVAPGYYQFVIPDLSGAALSGLGLEIEAQLSANGMNVTSQRWPYLTVEP